MNYFVEGLQGSGKSTLIGTLSEKYPEHAVFREGDYSPVELAWCAYVSDEKYQEILEKYKDIRDLIAAKTQSEGDRRIICYTQIITDIPGFHKNLEQYEIYNNRIKDKNTFQKIILDRYKRWNGDKMIFECSLFQNIVEDMLLFQNAGDEEVMDFYRAVGEVLKDKPLHIYYLKTEDVAANIGVIRKERSDDQGNELWYPMMLAYFDSSPYAKARGISGEEKMYEHFRHRQELELRICREIFSDRYTVLTSKNYEL